MFPRLILALSLPAFPIHALPVFIGTNTGGNSTSKGIYFSDFNPESGSLTAPRLAVEYQNPGFLALHPTKPVLFAVGAPKTPFADGTSSAAAFSIGADHSLKFLGETSTGGKGACHIAVDAAGRTVAVANYGDGSISSIRLTEDGSLLETVSVISNKGSGPHSRQAGPHAHGVYFDKANTHLFVPDLGLDQVLVYQFDPATSRIGDAMPPLKTAPGAGPRHMAFTPDEKHAYVINELDGTVLAAGFADGGFTALGTAPTLPKEFSGNNTTAEIETSADGRFVYGSNRGHDSIVVFSRDAGTGALTVVQHARCGGEAPRHFKLSPDGKWLLCGHQASNTISVLPIDPVTGKLGEAACTVPCPSPICILFAN